jgi:DNA-directed RNA polymerase subunit RPC12/RpoP
MSEFKFNCNHCGQRMKCEEQFVGREIECPACKRNVVVPWPLGKPTGMTFVPETWRKPPSAEK